MLLNMPQKANAPQQPRGRCDPPMARRRLAFITYLLLRSRLWVDSVADQLHPMREFFSSKRSKLTGFKAIHLIRLRHDAIVVADD